MGEVFADTAGWGSFFARGDAFHAVAAGLLRRWQDEQVTIVTTNYVLAELVALLTSPLRIPHASQVRAIESVRGTRGIEVVFVDQPLEAEAWGMWRRYGDKQWSLVDCASFVVMQRRGIREALTSDHHFEQAGFVRLLR